MLLQDAAKELLSKFEATKNGGPVDKLNYHIFKNICDAFDRNRKNCWTSSIAPFEFIPLFDMMNLPIELVISNLTRFGKATQLIDLGTEAMESREICTCMRGCTGGITADQYPRPDMLMRSSHFCVGADKLFDITEEKYQVPYHLINVPVNDIPGTVDYVARQFEDIFYALEDYLGVTITQSKFEKVFGNINKTYSNFKEIGRLMMQVPMPATEEIYASPWLFTFLLGSPEAVVISKDMIDRIKENIKIKNYPVQEEKYRIMFTGGVPWFPNPIADWIRSHDHVALFKNMDYLAPYGFFGIKPLDASDPFKSLANLMVQNALELRTPELVVEGQYQFAKRNTMDGIIHCAPWACMIAGGSLPSMKNYMAKKNLPFLEFDLDCYDKRNFDAEYIQKKISLFLNTIMR